MFDFNIIIRFTIGKSRAWKVTHAAYRDCFPQDWNEVWAGRTTNDDFLIASHRTTGGDAMMEPLLRKFADCWLVGRYWDTAQWTCTTTTP